MHWCSNSVDTFSWFDGPADFSQTYMGSRNDLCPIDNIYSHFFKNWISKWSISSSCILFALFGGALAELSLLFQIFGNFLKRSYSEKFKASCKKISSLPELTYFCIDLVRTIFFCNRLKKFHYKVFVSRKISKTLGKQW